MSLDAQVDQAELLGGRIRALRRDRGLTLVQLSELSGLSHPFLSQVENGRARPSFTSLDRIATALSTTQFELFAEIARAGRGDDNPGFAAGDGVVVDEGGGVTGRTYAEGSVRAFAGRPAGFTPMEITADNTAFGEYFTHPEEEFCYVLDGVAEAQVADRTVRLPAGTTIYYPGGTRHRWRSGDGGPFRILYVKGAAPAREDD
ncbi:XRE family transcriptional regulator [Agromyces rhizosphaerae]|uniref:XRE family transcriptional regulator n=1 Tax=Agromyces rhizosphaerae TaxID=88374 RepID=A0A9W6CWT6_9MICO|nr:XRE family transcriptional regulator [Agromyces rhizosphaerae]GLI28032.1 XRE family transcriptional regulator [Agromyces rhizosphaerae]